jgi:hypothetical protein
MSSPPNPAHAIPLGQLAKAGFPNLTQAEEKLLEAAPLGKCALCGPDQLRHNVLNDPLTAQSWGPERQIRSGLIRWICVDRQVRELVDPLGIHVIGAKISGGLDLPTQSCLFPSHLRGVVLERT